MRSDFKRLYRSHEERKIAGLCGGFGVFFGIDPVFIRLAWVAITLMTGVLPGIVAYLVGWFLVPPEPPAFATTSEHVSHAGRTPA